jgi:hypothetical protein
MKSTIIFKVRSAIMLPSIGLFDKLLLIARNAVVTDSTLPYVAVGESYSDRPTNLRFSREHISL